LSVKEIARIQTFPDWYEFSRGTSSKNDNAKLDLVYKQIGNAVPVRLALAVAEPIAEFAKAELEKQENTRYVVVGNVVEKQQMMA
jgi:DNA (cytosine-5)-methyltransferase 1